MLRLGVGLAIRRLSRDDHRDRARWEHDALRAATPGKLPNTEMHDLDSSLRLRPMHKPSLGRLASVATVLGVHVLSVVLFPVFSEELRICIGAGFDAHDDATALDSRFVVLHALFRHSPTH